MSDAAATAAQSRPARRYWQIHLSTIILATLGVGVFAMLNSGHPPPEPAKRVEILSYWGTSDCEYYGWPVRIASDDIDGNRLFLPRYMLIDLVVALAGIGGITLASEYLIRRRKRQS